MFLYASRHPSCIFFNAFRIPSRILSTLFNACSSRQGPQGDAHFRFGWWHPPTKSCAWAWLGASIVVVRGIQKFLEITVPQEVIFFTSVHTSMAKNIVADRFQGVSQTWFRTCVTSGAKYVTIYAKWMVAHMVQCSVWILYQVCCHVFSPCVVPCVKPNMYSQIVWSAAWSGPWGRASTHVR